MIVLISVGKICEIMDLTYRPLVIKQSQQIFIGETNVSCLPDLTLHSCGIENVEGVIYVTSFSSILYCRISEITSLNSKHNKYLIQHYWSVQYGMIHHSLGGEVIFFSLQHIVAASLMNLVLCLCVCLVFD